jgi:hypothetical protein
MALDNYLNSTQIYYFMINCHLVICGTSITDNHSKIPAIPDGTQDRELKA